MACVVINEMSFPYPLQLLPYCESTLTILPDYTIVWIRNSRKTEALLCADTLIGADNEPFVRPWKREKPLIPVSLFALPFFRVERAPWFASENGSRSFCSSFSLLFSRFSRSRVWLPKSRRIPIIDEEWQRIEKILPLAIVNFNYEYKSCIYLIQL